MARFNMQDSFSLRPETDEEQDGVAVSSSLLHKYNSQYNLIYEQIHKFLQQCKQSVQRFVALHNFGVGLNLPTLLSSLSQVERAFNYSIEQKQKALGTEPRCTAKHKYQHTFNKLVVRMSTLLTDIYQCEQQFKQDYFVQPKQKQKQPDLLMISSIKVPNNKSTSKKSNRSPKIQQNHKQDQQQEIRIRNNLNQQLKPQIIIKKAMCKEDNTTNQNLYILNEKVEGVIRHMRATRERQIKLIELFNMNRNKSLIIADRISNPTPSPSTDVSPKSDHEQMDLQLQQSCRRLRKQNNQHSVGFLNEGNFKKNIPILMQTTR